MKASLLTLSLLASLPMTALAYTSYQPGDNSTDNLSYNYVEGSYVKTNASDGDADGWGVKASFALAPNFHVFGDLDRQDIDHSGGDYFNEWRIGAGYNTSINQTTDFLGRIAYNQFDPSGTNWHKNGMSVEAGVRSMLFPNFEGYALAGYEDYNLGKHDDPAFDGTFYGRLGAQYRFNPNWGVVADVKLAEHGDYQWSIGPRLTW